jgi:cell division protein FtsQ
VARKKQQARRKQSFTPGFGWVKPLLAAFIMLGSGLGLTMMLEWMKDPRQWPVNSVRIDGRFQHLAAADLQETVATLAAAGFFVVDVSEIQARLKGKAWVDQVSVRRVWPDELDIDVVEQQPVASWGETSYLNTRAEVFTPEHAVTLAGLPRLAGPAGYEQRVLQMHARMQALLQPLQLTVGALSLDARRAWRVQLTNGLTLEVGRNHPLQRVTRFVKVYPAIANAADGRLTAVDLRYSNGFAAHWQTVDAEARHSG